MPPRTERAWVPRAVWLVVFLLVGWGAFAFGAVYPWAYRPLMAASAATGLAGLLAGRGRVPVAFALTLCLVAAGALVQLVPLSAPVLQRVAPATHAFLLDYDIGYAFRGVGHLSINPEATRRGIELFLAFGVLAVGLARLLSRRSARAAAGAIIAVGAALALLGLAHGLLFGEKIYGFWKPLQGGSSMGPFVNRNHFAGWMTMALPLAVAVSIGHFERGRRSGAFGRGFRSRVLWLGSGDGAAAMMTGFAALMMVIALAFSMSRSGMLATALGGMVLLVGPLHRVMPRARALFLVIVLTGVTLAVVGPEVLGRRWGSTDLQTLGGRWPIWQDAWHLAATYFPFGSGLNTFGTATLMYQRSVPGLHLAQAHNDYLQIAAEGGLVLGLPAAAAVWALGVTVRSRLRHQTGRSYWLRVGAAFGLLAIALQSIAEFSLQMPGNAVLCAVLCGIALHERRVSGQLLPTR